MNMKHETNSQTWVVSVIGPDLVDQWFGPGASLKIWEKTKELSVKQNLALSLSSLCESIKIKNFLKNILIGVQTNRISVEGNL